MKKTLTCSFPKSKRRVSSMLLVYVAFLLLGLGKAAPSFASNAMQEEVVTISVTDTPVDQVLELITRQTSFNFVYSIDDMRNLPPVTLDYTNATVETVLEDCFRNSNFTYELSSDKVIVILARDRQSNQQEEAYIAKGKVIDEDGNPLPGATVLLKSTTMGVISDVNGEFTIRMQGPGSLVVSFIGFNTIEVPVYAGLDQVIVSMKSAVSELDDIVVSTGYQKVDKTAAIGSFEQISAREIQQTPSVNPLERLAGKASGVRVNTSDNTIEIRGTNTFYESRPPLLVIDGFPALRQSLIDAPDTELSGTSSMETNNAVLSSINPNDIESITFLKDAAAASIWGSQAANGVIVIETKKGRGREESIPVISFSSNVSIAAPADLDELNVMNSRQYIDMERELFDLGFVTDPYSAWRYSNESDAMNLLFANQRGEITDEQLESSLDELGSRNNTRQLRDHLLQEEITQQYNLSVSGNSQSTQYYLSGAYSSNRPDYRSNDQKQYSVTANITTKLFNDRVTLSTNLNQNFSKSKVNDAALMALTPGMFGLRPYDNLVDQDGNSIDRYLKFTPDIIDDFTAQGYMPWTYNTLDELNYNNTNYNKYATRINTRLSGKVVDWLTASVSGSYQRLSTEWRRLQNEDSYDTRDLINEGTTVGANGSLVYGVPVGGMMETSNTYSSDYSFRAQLDADKTWNKVHHLSVIAGSEIRQSKASGYTQTRYGYDELTGSSSAFNPTTPYNNIYGYTFTLGYDDGSIFQDRQRYLSYYGNVNYSYLARYYLSGSVRFDDTNMLGVSRRNRAQPLWSGGLKWRIAEESFLKDASFVDVIDLRASYGVGGSAPSSGVNRSTISIVGNDSYSGLPYGSLYLGNRDLGWEKTKTFNAGLDLAFFRNRLRSSVDVYTKRSSGILVTLPINGTYGQTDLAYNTGTLSGHGVDFSLHGSPIRSSDWGWDVDFNLSYNTNKVTDSRFPNTITNPGSNSVVIEGYPVDYLLAYRWAGLDEEGQSLISDAEGNIITSDMGTVSLEPEDLKYAGRRTPPYFGSLATTIRYKHLSLYLQANYSIGHKLLVDNINTSQYPTSGYFTGFISNSEALVNRWRNPGDEATTNIPGLANTNFQSIDRYRYADINVISGSNIRMQQISLNYQMPSSVIKTLGFIQAMNVGATVENLGLIWTKNKDYDPDYIFSGTYSSLPPSKRFTFSLNVSF